MSRLALFLFAPIFNYFCCKAHQPPAEFAPQAWAAFDRSLLAAERWEALRWASRFSWVGRWLRISRGLDICTRKRWWCFGFRFHLQLQMQLLVKVFMILSLFSDITLNCKEPLRGHGEIFSFPLPCNKFASTPLVYFVTNIKLHIYTHLKSRSENVVIHS